MSRGASFPHARASPRVGRHRVAIRPMGDAGLEWKRRYRVEWAVVVGARLRRLRETHGLRLSDLEIFRPDGVPYSSSFFSRLENGWGTPPLWVYVTLALGRGADAAARSPTSADRAP
jgi:hypothetical protein